MSLTTGTALHNLPRGIKVYFGQGEHSLESVMRADAISTADKLRKKVTVIDLHGAHKEDYVDHRVTYLDGFAPAIAGLDQRFIVAVGVTDTSRLFQELAPWLQENRKEPQILLIEGFESLLNSGLFLDSDNANAFNELVRANSVVVSLTVPESAAELERNSLIIEKVVSMPDLVDPGEKVLKVVRYTFRSGLLHTDLVPQ